MSFWDLSDNTSAANTGNDYEIPGGNMEPIPDGSTVLAAVDVAKWARKDNNDPDSPSYIELRWNVLAPDTYKNRKVFHKLWVTDLDQMAKDQSKAVAKRDKARRMLAAIDANAGGKLTQSPGIPTDEQLAMALIDKPMAITLMVWEISDARGTASGNWVSAVAPKTKQIYVKQPAPRKPSQNSYASGGDGFGGGQHGGGGHVMDDEIPF